MARPPRTDTAVSLCPDRAPWEPQPNEPAIWYTRFAEYLRLGPTRTMQRVRDNLCQETGKTSYKCGGHWSVAAQKWRWQERARAWDIDQCQRYADERRTMEVALHMRRLEIYNEGIEMCLDTLRAANLAAMTQEQARAMFGQMSRFLIKLLREERIECESYRYLDDEAAAVHLTADDLIAAQRALQQRMNAVQGDAKVSEGTPAQPAV
jgi:hypothetical protein